MLLIVFLQEIGRFRMAEAVAVHLGTTRSVVIVLKTVAVKSVLKWKALDRSHALRGHASLDVLRPLCDPARHRLHAHAERGDDHALTDAKLSRASALLQWFCVNA
jgi:hypothetical protein